jgi:hypothetical protein
VSGDRRPDLITANFRTSVSLLLGRGDGSFDGALDFPVGGGGVAVGDVNRDGRNDLVAGNDRRSTISVLLNTPGLCNVQAVRGMLLAAAKRQLARLNCRVGTVRKRYSNVTKGRVISQRPRFGTVRPGGARVNLEVSTGQGR